MVALFMDNYIETLDLLTEKQRNRIKNMAYDYIVLDVQCTNTGAWVNLSLTNKIPIRKLNRGECSVFDKETFTYLMFDYERETGKRFYN